MSMILEYAECMDMGPLRSDSPFNMKSLQIKSVTIDLVGFLKHLRKMAYAEKDL